MTVARRNSTTNAMASYYLNQSTRSALEQISSNLSESIILESLERLINTDRKLSSASTDRKRIDQLLTVLASRQANLELILRKSSSSSSTEGPKIEHRRESSISRTTDKKKEQLCPLCDGSGSLRDDVIRIKLELEEQIREQIVLDLSEPVTGNESQEIKSNSSKIIGRLLSKLAGSLLSKPTLDGLNGGAQDVSELKQLIGDCRRRPSLEQLLANLRTERRKLDEQHRKSQQQQPQTNASQSKQQTTLASVSSSNSSSEENSTKTQIRLPGGQSASSSSSSLPSATSERASHHQLVSSGRSIINAARGQLSSNIQRMKRMDTLKRRKLKREQQLADSNQTNTDSRLLSLGVTAENQEANNFTSIRFAKVGSGLKNEDYSNQLDRKLAQVIKTASNPIVEECIAEEYCGDSNGNEDEHDISQLATVNSPEPVTKPTNKAADSDGHKITADKQRKGPQSASYNYQSFRASLASLVNEAVNSRYKLNLINRFSSFSASNSPVKKPPQIPKRPQNCQSISSLNPNSPATTVEIRKQSSRSHSSSSGCGLGPSTATSSKRNNCDQSASIDKTPNHGGRSSNCSCLRSSASSQSFESS